MDVRQHLLDQHGWSEDSEGFATMDEAALKSSHAQDHAETVYVPGESGHQHGKQTLPALLSTDDVVFSQDEVECVDCGADDGPWDAVVVLDGKPTCSRCLSETWT